ncbi:MAG: ribosome small subunit-dependent GTPase A [Peptoniphilus sp.]|nr:ribosome small subunit-dependent GTPase A [Peptoniphilus sp.]MDY3119284.1 ribosome small subunit-dependent GTPase A [Peptoniphilus sp.]
MKKKGRITKLLGGFYYVTAEDGEVYETRARGIFRHQKRKPVVGDYVELSIDDGDRLNSVEEIFPRKNSLLRPPVANVDQVFLFIPTANPKYNLYLADKMLAYYEQQGIVIIPVISKYDIDIHEAEGLCALYEDCGYPVMRLSEKDEKSVESLRAMLSHKTTVLSGVSGSGKTTFLNRVLNLGMETGTVSEKTNRGKHTTRHTEIFSGSDGIYLFDTPGFSSIEISSIPSTDLDAHFREFVPYMKNCKFQDCRHIKEPGCAVREAYESSRIATSRFENYRRFYEELVAKENEKWR